MIQDLFLKVLEAQAKNVLRIEPGLEVDPSNVGSPNVELTSKRPGIVRHHYAPFDFLEDKAVENCECAIAINPQRNAPDGRAANRSDRVVRYRLSWMVKLLQSEITADRPITLHGGYRDLSPLARKVHEYCRDFHSVFYDNYHLITDEFPNGLVDDSVYTIEWNDEVVYPASFFNIDITSSISGYE